MITAENIPLFLAAAFTAATACTAFALRNIVHGAILLAATWAGLAAYYLWAGVEFIAFAQVLVYVGAISMVVLFAVLLTRRGGDAEEPPAAREATVERAWRGILGRAAMVFLFLGCAVATYPFPEIQSSQPTDVAAQAPSAVKAIGWALLTRYPVALLITGTLLSVALLGAVHLAAPAKREP